MTNSSNKIELDRKKLNRMKIKIFRLESANAKTGRYRYREMVDEIYKIIQEEYNKTL